MVEVVLFLPNRFEKPKAGGAILITVNLAQALIKCTNFPPLVGNTHIYEVAIKQLIYHRTK